ncbi:glycoside hydrolase family 9 protein [Mucilaginibacter sp.]|jgi:endoglucanase|uniref:glycoside hydrolase family 9 protein n=1 Tax=Mucilaginibacter sp. TaxID=1882438 RepID=UPI002CA1D463|nr:glycoside hydrolase family 9 protein [Mucilaginibacter sp.]HTI61802.1 glycoside hydrolase family 9 protein [Mucilaginibacter sp.]
MLKRISFSVLILFLLSAGIAAAQAPADSAKQLIRLDQIGFYPNGPKIAIVLGDSHDDFIIRNTAGKQAFKGKLKRSDEPAFNGKYTSVADFSAFNKPGKYVLEVKGLGDSYSFEIKSSVYRELANGLVKAYYFQRVSVPLPEKYAGKWARTEGHPDDKVLVHASAASAERPEGTVISSPRGWYDAGDYNKYIVNSGISTYTLLALYEDFPAYMKAVRMNIPESGNGVPDILNESLWNIRWMLTMQDPNDGGVYHKLTNPQFDKMIMPDQATNTRYVVQKSTAAALDFAAVMAQSARIFKQFPKQLPGLADSCLAAAKQAWEWAQKNPDAIYSQNVINQKFEPKIVTGEYGDRYVSDEFIWAASELFVTTHDDQYIKKTNILPDDKMPLPSWSQVRLLGYYSILRNSNGLKNSFPEKERLKKNMITFADNLVKGKDSTAYHTVMQKKRANFIWGSNSVAANEGIALLEGYKLTHDKKYLDAALSNLDYLLGRNGTGYSFVTGFGSKTPMHPHHRPSIADGITEPVPGLLVAGANPRMQDHVKVPSTVPDEAYIDNDQAYAVNEIAINWNAPMAYLANAIEALQNELAN